MNEKATLRTGAKALLAAAGSLVFFGRCEPWRLFGVNEGRRRPLLVAAGSGSRQSDRREAEGKNA